MQFCMPLLRGIFYSDEILYFFLGDKVMQFCILLLHGIF